MPGLFGVTPMETRVAEVTVSKVDPEILPDVAEIVVEPVATALASPSEPAALLMVPAAMMDDSHVTMVDTSCVVLSENVPVAVNCCCVPVAILGLAGVTARAMSVAEVTVSVVDPEISPDDAVIVVSPAAMPDAVPLVPEVSLIVATALSDDVQIVDSVSSCTVLSVNVPMAVNCCVVSMAMLGLAGVIAIETSVAGVTVTSAYPNTLSNCAVIRASPELFAMVCPGLRLVSAAATDGDDVAIPTPSSPDAISTVSTSDEVHMTDDVRSFVVLSEYIPIAVNC